MNFYKTHYLCYRNQTIINNRWFIIYGIKGYRTNTKNLTIMKKQFLLLVALVASVFTTANAQVEYGNVTTPLTGAKTWDFASFPGLESSTLVDACTIDNLYFGVSSNTGMYYVSANARISLPYSANQTFLDDEATDCVLSFKVPAGKGTVTVNGKSASNTRPGIVFIGTQKQDQEGDSIKSTLADYTYSIDVAEPTSIYIIAENAKSNANASKGQGLYVYKLTWTPGDGDTTGITQMETDALNDGNYYNLQGMRVADPKNGIFIHNGKKVVLK